MSETKDKFTDKPGHSKNNRSTDNEMIKARMKPNNIFNYRKSLDQDWIDNFNNSPSKVDPKLL